MFPDSGLQTPDSGLQTPYSGLPIETRSLQEIIIKNHKPKSFSSSVEHPHKDSAWFTKINVKHPRNTLLLYYSIIFLKARWRGSQLCCAVDMFIIICFIFRLLEILGVLGAPWGILAPLGGVLGALGATNGRLGTLKRPFFHTISS